MLQLPKGPTPALGVVKQAPVQGGEQSGGRPQNKSEQFGPCVVCQSVERSHHRWSPNRFSRQRPVSAIRVTEKFNATFGVSSCRPTRWDAFQWERTSAKSETGSCEARSGATWLEGLSDRQKILARFCALKAEDAQLLETLTRMMDCYSALEKPWCFLAIALLPPSAFWQAFHQHLSPVLFTQPPRFAEFCDGMIVDARLLCV